MTQFLQLKFQSYVQHCIGKYVRIRLAGQGGRPYNKTQASY